MLDHETSSPVGLPGPVASQANAGQSASNLAAKARVLVVDDEPGMRNFLQKSLAGVCAQVDVTENTEAASVALDTNTYDVVVLDNIMPQKTGIEWLAEQRRIGLFSDAILITAHADLDTAIAAIRAGASDFLLKPFRSNQLINAIGQSLVRTQLRRQNALLRHELEAGRDILKQRDALVGQSSKMEAVRSAIDRAAAAPSQVVIRGEVGSGSQIAARMVHNRSPRAASPFVWLQCNGMTEEAFRTRLFGRISTPDHVSHAQSIQSTEDGMLVSAAGGTLYLEDVDMLSGPCQMVLTELLTTGRFQPIGALRSVGIDIRVISSTSRSLDAAVTEGRFRQDLFYLLNVVELTLPPLRERSEDIIELTEFFMDDVARRMGVEKLTLDPAIRRRLMAHAWPGNVIELRNTVERALIQGDFANAINDRQQLDETESLADVEKRHILSVLESCNGNRAEASRRLGVARKTIDRKCQAWGL
ncbi:MAG: sigma-54 dependent transcriptional regulator [Pseudomonadota bacterium]